MVVLEGRGNRVNSADFVELLRERLFSSAIFRVKYHKIVIFYTCITQERWD